MFEALRDVGKVAEARVSDLIQPRRKSDQRILIRSAEEKRIDLLLAIAKEDLDYPESHYRAGFVCVKCQNRFCSLDAFRIHCRNCYADSKSENKPVMLVTLFMTSLQ